MYKATIIDYRPAGTLPRVTAEMDPSDTFINVFHLRYRSADLGHLLATKMGRVPIRQTRAIDFTLANYVGSVLGVCCEKEKFEEGIEAALLANSKTRKRARLFVDV